MFCCYRRLWFWCCYCCWNRWSVLQLWFLLKTFSQIIWQSDQAVIQNCCVCVCSTLKCSMFDGGWTLLLNCCSQHFLFIVEILIIEKIRISLYDVSNIRICYARSWWTKVKDSTKWLVVSKPLQRVYKFLSRDGYWLSTKRLIVVYRVVGRQGVDFERSHQWLMHWSSVYNACNWFNS